LFQIKKEDFGFRITISGVMDISEAEQFTVDMLKTLSEHKKQFSLLIDIRNLATFTPEVMKQIQMVQKACKEMSLHRAAIITGSPVLTNQRKRSAYETGIANHACFIDALIKENWEELAMAWILEGIKPSIESKTENQTFSQH